MSKIGRRPINLDGVQVEVAGKTIDYKGPYATGTYKLPEDLKAVVEDKKLTLTPVKDYAAMSKKMKRQVNRIWGLHRALLANKIRGAAQEFVQKLEINGLGYKATKVGKNLEFSLGYSHKIDFELPEGVSVEIDKSGKKLTVKSFNKFLMGKICSDIQSLREPEPYKGTGIKLENQEIRRKAGKTKAA
jgi:large subunit ribosomal protein L6